ncbi:MAG: GNAT family N-acetyltransferase [Rubrivivax sp.]|nr:GNAT family N-acetyltransferase [Rubrivivax sp.]
MVELLRPDDPSAFESEWRRLEQGTDVSFFLSWDWVGALLELLPTAQRPDVVRVSQGDGSIALGLLGSGVERRRRVIRSRTLHLNETGRAEFDLLTIEHNGLVVASGQAQHAVEALFARLCADNNWDELLVGGLAAEAYPAWMRAAHANGLQARCRWEKEYYFVDLAKVRAAPSGYLGGLSSNTRHQIRRAMKLYGERGPLEYRVAASQSQAREWFDCLVGIHQEHWRAQGMPGAFGSEFPRRFHEALIERGWPRQSIEIARVSAGDAVVGYLYNFRKDGTLYNYQTGFAYEADARFKPGLVCHALAAEDASRRGLDRYDLLMGGGHYKRRLANAEGRMVWCTFQKRRWMLRLENRLRQVATTWRERRGPPMGAAPAPEPD